jgi:hypothetical protein
MRTKFISKAVIYLLVTTIALPMWFLSGLFTQKAAAAAPTITVYEKITNDTTPSLSGAVTDATADEITIFVDSIGYNNVVNGAGTIAVVSGVWTLADDKISPALAEGTYNVVASAVTSGGAKIDSTTDELIVDLTAPTVDSIDSSTPDGFYNAGDAVNVTVNFSEKVVLAVDDLEANLNSGLGVKADIAPFSASESSSGVYTIGSGEDSADLDVTSLSLAGGATLKDLAGNDAVLSIPASDNLADNNEIVIDTTDPVAPTTVSAVTNSPSATISWNAGSDANLAGYNVYRSDDGFTASISGLLPTTQLSYTDTSFSSTGMYSYEVSSVDKAGNETLSGESNSVYIYLSAPSAPVVAVTKVGDKLIKVEFKGVGGAAEKYETYVNGILSGTDTNTIGDDTGVTYSREISVTDYGTYGVYVKAIGMSGENSSAIQSITLVKATTTPVVKTVAGPVQVAVSAAPESAAAAEPTDEGAGLDEQGKILGDENASEEEEEDINWTPWIILFILIVLAGAATGGYFYWFSGEEDIDEAIEEVKERKPAAPKRAAKKPAPVKKSRRW